MLFPLTVDSLLNPCRCEDVWSCQCRASTSASASTHSHDIMSESTTGLAALARAAALSCGQDGNPESTSYPPFSKSLSANNENQQYRSVTPSHSHRVHLHTKWSNKSPTAALAASTPGPALPPLLFPPASSPLPELQISPVLANTMPPFSTFTLLAGSGCTCGLRCACPDCAEPRPETSAYRSRRECKDGCGDCVDEGVMGIELGAGAGCCGVRIATPPRVNTPGSQAMERFFAQAARLPLPPVHGGVPVALPKLCCGGSCRCGRSCGCSRTCGGCCDDTDRMEEDSERVDDASCPEVAPCCF